MDSHSSAGADGVLQGPLGAPARSPDGADKIVIHPIADDGAGAVPSRSSWSSFGLNLADFVDMSRAELIEYYGINVYPTLPADLKARPAGRTGIFRRNGGAGEVYYDGNQQSYFDETGARSVGVAVSKNAPLPSDCVFTDGSDEKSVIHGVEVAIGRAAGGAYYFADFTHRGVRFQITAMGLTQDELVSVIASLLW